ncbi:MAG: OmpP1/FadL family transporter [bacterium]
MQREETQTCKRPVLFGLLISLAFCGVESTTFAQTSIPRPPTVPVNLNFLRVDFIIPGARPSALGGAFIAAAFDETAAVINPAGLTFLTEPAASLHQRQARFEFKEPEGSPDHPNGKKKITNNSFDQNMVNIVYPFKRFSFSTFRQVSVDSRFNFETRQFLTTEAPLDFQQKLGGLGNFPGRKVNLSLEVVNNGVAMAFKFSDNFSFGVSLKISELNINLTESKFLDPEITSKSGPVENSVENLYSVSSLDRAEPDPSFSFGFLGKLLFDRLFVGGVLNINPRFAVTNKIFLPEYRLGSLVFEAAEPENETFFFSIPDTYGLGFYYLASDRLRFSFDLLRIEYSDLLNGNDLNAVEDDVFVPVSGSYIDPDGEPDLTVDDVFEVHLGLEYLVKVPRLGFVPVRVGFHTDPGHRVYARKNDPDLRRLFPKAIDRVHFTFGLGFILNRNLKIDGSLNYAENGIEFIGSTLITFSFN